ncbi:MAG: NUDIX domain-containing protein [Deltaproteobacteria bacterium]|nr:NUDIX domain-containing protein [Deltaproteobacteria bacterium]
MSLTYCTTCGGKLVDRPSSTSEALRRSCPACGITVYDTPYVVVATLPVIGDRVVLVRRATNPGSGLWSYPGGYLETSETLEAGAVRETREETGLDVKISGLLGVYSRPGGRTVTVIFEATTEHENWKESPEVSEVKSFPVSGIPWDELAFWTAKYALEDWIYTRENGHPLPRAWRVGPPRR